MAKSISEMLEEERKKRDEEERKRQEEANRILESLHNKKDQTTEEDNTLSEWIEGNKEQNVGGFGGGLQYVGQSFLNGIVGSIEGIVDYTVGGLAKLFGGRSGEKYAEELMENDWYDYEAAEKKYNPNWLMKGVGDVSGGLGQGVFSIGTGALVTLATGGAGLAPTLAKGIGVAADIGIDYLSSAGRAVASAVQDEGADNKGLTDDKWAGGSLSGLMEASLGQIVPAAGKLGNKVLGETSYEMGSEIVESVTKRITKNLTNSSVGKEILGEMAGEAIEEGLSAYLEPYIKRGTYDSDASNASVGDVLYSALIGGITGGISSGTVKGIETTVNAATNTKRGNEIASDTKKLNGLLQNAEIISSYESERHTGSSVFEAVVKQYNKVMTSLESTGGVAATLDQKKMLGELDAYVAQAVLQPTLVESAKNVVYNADAYAESLNNFYKKTGSDAVVTAADLTAGLDTTGDSRSFVKSVSTALKNNGALRGVVLNNALGQMEMDTRAYANSIYGGTSISAVASQENINRFVETADEDTIKSVEATLGVDMRTVTPEVLAESIMRWRDSGAAAIYEGGFKDVQDAVNTLEFIDDLPSEYDLEGNSLESIIKGGNVQTSRIKEGVTRFTHGDTDIAIIKRGEGYRIYDYKSGKVSRTLTRSELSSIVRQLRGGGKTIEVIGRLVESAEGRVQSAELDALAMESIPEYKSLNESEKLAIRETLRRAMANGISERDAVLFGKISAKSGMNIVALNDADYKAQLGEGSDAKFDGRNTVYINADADRSSVFSGLLGHEMWHKIFKSGRGKKLFMKAYKEMPEDKRADVEKRYTDEMGKLGYGEETSKKIAKEEVAAAYAEELFHNSEVWDYVLSEEPSLKDRVLSFFKGANKKYSFEPGMTAAAKKWLKEYKRLFNELGTYNKGQNTAENTVASEGVKRIEKIGRLEDGKLTLLKGNNAAENTLLRALNAEKAQESSSSTASGSPVSPRARSQNGSDVINVIQDRSAASLPILGKAKVDDGSRKALKKEDPLKAARSDADEHVALVRELMKETKTEEEKIELSRYISELKGMDEKLYDRTVLRQTYESNTKKINDLFAKVKESAEYKEYSSEKDKAKRKELQKEYQSTEAYKEYLKEKRRIDAENSALEERLELLDNEISRRDSVLLEVSALAPVRDLVQRAYKIGKTEGATARVTPGVIKKRLAQMLHSKMFSYSEAKAAIDQIANKYGIDNYLDRSDLARQLWTQLNSTENRGEQKAAITNMADEIIKRRYSNQVKGQKSDLNFVRRVQKYKKRIVFDEWERRNIEKYYSGEADNIFSIWEYDGNKNVKPKKISDLLWDAGQVPKYSQYADFEYSAPSDRSDMFYQLLGEFETHEERVTDIDSSAKSEKRDIIDILWRVFEDGGKETYKAKYNEEVGHRKIYRTIERRVMAFENLEKGRFKNATEGGGDLFVNTLDQIPKMLYKGSLYPGRANKVLEGLNKWYIKENNMLGYVNDSNPGLFDKDIKEMLENLTADKKRTKYNYEELQAIDSVLQYFYNFVEHYNKIYRRGLWVDALPVAEGWLAGAQKQEASAKMPLEVLFKNKYVKGFGDTESVMKLCDGYEDGIFTDTFDQLREGYINSKVLEMETLEAYEGFLARKENKGFVDSLYKDTAEVNGVKIPRYALIGYYLSLQREHARAGLAYNGFSVPSADGKRLIKVPGFSKIEYVYDENKSQEQNRRDEITMINRFAENELASLRKKLTKQEKEYISIIESTFAACKGIKEDADVKMYGYTNCADGYYYPIRRYAVGMGATLDVYTDMMGVDRFTNASFNKNVTKGAKQALYIEDPAAVLSRHVKNLCLYANVSPVVDNFNRLWNLDVASNANLPTSLKTFYDESERAWKEDKQSVGFKYLQSLITDIMNGGKHDLGFGAKLMSYLRGSYATFALGGVTAGNPKVLMTQLSSIVSSTALLKNSSILKSVAISGADVDKYCPLAKLRNRDDSAVRAQSVMDNISEKQKFWTAGISWMDRQVVKRLFAACQAEAESTLGLKVGTEANKVEAGKILHDVILETQQNALITERTESMRSGSEFMKSLSMFRGDSIKNFGRLIDASGELLYLKAQLDGATQEERAVLNGRIKEAGKKFGKSLGSIMTNAALLVGISHLFDNLLAKDDDEEKPWYLEFIVDLGGNILGGLPVISQAFSKIHEGYGLEGFEYSVVNDILDALVKLTNLTKDFATGELTTDKLAKNFNFIIDSIGQVTHTPTRNIRKVMLGLINRFSPEAGYRIDDIFNNKNYGTDLEAAIEAGDDLMALTIIELAMKERLGSGLSDKAIKEMARLTEFLKDKSTILPTAVGDSLTIDGEKRELAASEVRAVREKYSEVIEQLNKFIEGDFYKKLSDEDKAAAVKKIYALYNDLAYDTVIGTEKDKKAMILSKVVPAESLVLWEVAGVIDGDKDENGKTITGSEKENVIEAIMAEKISLEEKLLLIGMRGNSLNGGDIEGMTGYEARTKLYEYIKGLDVSDADRDALLEYCGFKDRDDNGTIDEPLPSDINNSYKSDLFDAIESGDTKGAGEITNLAVRENLGKDIAKDTANEIVRLAGLGKNVLPSAIQDSITVNGKERELTAAEYKAAMKKYSVAAAEVDKLIKSDIYKSLNDDQKASALKSVFDMFKNIAYDTTLGTDNDKKAVVLSKVVDASTLVIWDVASTIDYDRDENGYTIDGSRKDNIINAIWGEKLSYEEKLLLIGANRYNINGGDLGDVTGYEARIDLYEYISDLDGIEEYERLELYRYCGFADESGNVREPLQADVETTYEKDLKAAIESDDAKRAVEIVSLAMRESFGKDVGNDTVGELLRLTVIGKDVLTSAISNKISINGKTRELTVDEYKAVFEKSSVAASEIEKLVKSDVYKSLNDDQRASVVNSVYDMFKDIAYDTTIGTEKNSKATALSKIVNTEALVLWKTVSVYEADKDENGKSISRSKKAKIVNAIWSSGYTDEEKLLLIGMNGYKVDDDDIAGVTGYQAQMALYNYIASLEGVTEEERLTIYKECGYTIENGVAVEPTEKSSSSSSSSSKKSSGSTVKRIGWKLGGGTMVGSLIGKDYTKKIVKLGKIKN